MSRQHQAVICIVSILLLLAACGADEEMTPEDKEEFISFMDSLGLVYSGSVTSIGTTVWHFEADTFVFFGTVSSKVDDNWLVTSYGGNYTLSSNPNLQGEYVASCHFILKETRFLPSDELIEQDKHDEERLVFLKRDGQALLINGVKHEKRE